MKIGCIILAGGKSSRMGGDKALLEYEGKYFIEKIAEELSFFEEKIIARGNNSSLTEITDSKWQVIPDIYLDHGPMGGMHAHLFFICWLFRLSLLSLFWRIWHQYRFLNTF